VEFWRQTPRETFDIVDVYIEKEAERKKEEWKRFRWLATRILNISGKVLKADIKEDDLFKFADEIEIVDPEKRKKEAMETLRRLKLKIFDEEDYKKLMKTMKEN